MRYNIRYYFNSRFHLLLPLIIIAIIIIKISIIFNLKYPWIFADEAVYLQTASSIMFTWQIIPDLDAYAQLYPPGYSTLFMIPLLFMNSPEELYKFVLYENLFLSIIFFILAYIYLRNYYNKIESTIVATIIIMLPSVFPYGFVAMSESLFIFLLLLVFVVMSYIWNDNKNYLWHLLLGLIFGLIILTRMQGIFLFVAYIISILIYYFLKEKSKYILLKQLTTWFGLMILLVPYYILKFKTGEISITGYDNSIYINSLISWFTDFSDFKVAMRLLVNELMIFVLITFGMFLFTIINYVQVIRKGNKGTFIVLTYVLLSVLITLIITVAHMFPAYSAQNAYYATFTRYIDPLIPMVFLSGWHAYKQNTLPNKLIVNIVISIILATTYIFLPNENYKLPNVFSIWYINDSNILYGFVPIIILMLFNKYKKVVPWLLLLSILPLLIPLIKDIKLYSQYLDPIAREVYNIGAGKIGVKGDEIPANILWPLEFADFGGREIEVIDLDQVEQDYLKYDYFVSKEILFNYKLVQSQSTGYFLYDLSKPPSTPENGFYDIGSSDQDYTYNFYGSENGKYRWTKEKSYIVIENKGSKEQISLLVRLDGYRPQDNSANINIYFNNVLVSNYCKVAGPLEIIADVNTGGRKYGILTIETNTWNPEQYKINSDSRDLGVIVDWVRILNDTSYYDAIKKTPLGRESCRSKIILIGKSDIKIEKYETINTSIKLGNCSKVPWPNYEMVGNPFGSVRLGIIWFSKLESGKRLAEDRSDLPYPMFPNDEVEIKVPLRPVSYDGSTLPPGDYEVWVSPVQEGVSWFYEQGDEAIKLDVKIL